MGKCLSNVPSPLGRCTWTMWRARCRLWWSLNTDSQSGWKTSNPQQQWIAFLSVNSHWQHLSLFLFCLEWHPLEVTYAFPWFLLNHNIWMCSPSVFPKSGRTAFLSPWIPVLSSFLWFAYLILNHLDINLQTEVPVAKISLGFQEQPLKQWLLLMAKSPLLPWATTDQLIFECLPDIFLYPDLPLNLQLFALFCVLIVSGFVTSCPLRHMALTLYGVTHKK